MNPLQAIERLLTDPHYPCLPAQKSWQYGQLIHHHNPILTEVVDDFIDRYDERREQYLSLWCTFEVAVGSEAEYEKWLFTQLEPFRVSNQFLHRDRRLFVVGMHPNATRRSRKFPFNGFVVNLFDQFGAIKNYEALVHTIRQRDTMYSGSPNPMCVEHGESFEEIQFSGKLNPPTWSIDDT